jgi:hypothetical protein
VQAVTPRRSFSMKTVIEKVMKKLENPTAGNQ